MLCARKMMNRDYVSHRREGRLRKMWDAIKNTNMHIMGLPEGKDIAGAGDGGGGGKLEEIMAAKSPDLEKL